MIVVRTEAEGAVRRLSTERDLDCNIFQETKVSVNTALGKKGFIHGRWPPSGANLAVKTENDKISDVERNPPNRETKNGQLL